MNRPAVVSWSAMLLSGALLLGGCMPVSQSQFEEEKEPHFLAGKNRVNAMDFPGAVESFQKALEVNPHSASAHFELGWLHDQKANDPAAAIYHYNQYLRFRPKAANAEMVNTRILACKQELARTVNLGPVTQSMQKEFEQLTEENRLLKLEVEQLKGQVFQLQGLTNRPPVTIIHVGTNQRTAPVLTNVSNREPLQFSPNQPPPAGNRTHTVKAGETPTMIARAYSIRLDALLAANPGLEPRRMKVGQTLVIPGPR